MKLYMRSKAYLALYSAAIFSKKPLSSILLTMLASIKLSTLMSPIFGFCVFNRRCKVRMASMET